MSIKKKQSDGEVEVIEGGGFIVERKKRRTRAQTAQLAQLAQEEELNAVPPAKRTRNGTRTAPKRAAKEAVKLRNTDEDLDLEIISKPRKFTAKARAKPKTKPKTKPKSMLNDPEEGPIAKKRKIGATDVNVPTVESILVNSQSEQEEESEEEEESKSESDTPSDDEDYEESEDLEMDLELNRRRTRAASNAPLKSVSFVGACDAADIPEIIADFEAVYQPPLLDHFITRPIDRVSTTGFLNSLDDISSDESSSAQDDSESESEGERDLDMEFDLVLKSDSAAAKEKAKKIKKQKMQRAREKKKRKMLEKKRLNARMTYHEKTTKTLYDLHPELKKVFKKLESLNPVKNVRGVQPAGLNIQLLPFQLEGLHWLVAQENSHFQGGILADEMGMGKTVQTIALLLSDKEKTLNLIVAPAVALIQWKNEINQHTNNAFKIELFHGAGRNSDVNHLKSCDIILTTYSVLESVYRQQEKGFRKKGKWVQKASPLHSIDFHRVVLDEAHNIKDRNSNTSKSANALKSQKRWCLSGTPLQNRIGEVYSLIRFLKVNPFSNYYCLSCDCVSKHWSMVERKCAHCGHHPMRHRNYFNHFLLRNVVKYGIKQQGAADFKTLQIFLKNIMLRRTKIERASDLGLPPRIVEIRRDLFNAEERDLYHSLYSDSKREFNSYVNQGVILNNYANIFTLLTRMRQMADHPDLVLRNVSPHANSKKSNDNDNDNDDSNKDNSNKLVTLRKLKAQFQNIVCQLCDDEAEDAIESKCHHKFCRLCIKEYIESFTGDEKNLQCPVCHIPLSIDLTQVGMEVDEEVAKKSNIVNRINLGNEWRSSTKIEALVEELYKLRSDRQTIKSIVFSQFTSMLDLVEWRLKRAGFETVKLQGSMSPIQRNNSIKYFMENINVEVFLVSIKAGGVALNLCEASQVFILDPWWNPSVEYQSGDRVHRIGQHRPVKITRFCIQDSIEEKIIELQEKKATLINATIDGDEGSAGRLTSDDLQFLFSL